MKRIGIILLVLLGGTILFSSCHKDQPVTYALTNQDFVTHAASSYNFQIQAGTLAQTVGVNDSVKSYGANMVKDNTAAFAALKILATSKGLTVSTTLIATDQTNLGSISGQTGAKFDQAYAQTMILSHSQQLALFNVGAEAGGVADADLMAFSFNQLPLLNLRFQQAESLQTIVAVKQ